MGRKVASPGRLTEAQLKRLLRFPTIRQAISSGFKGAVPIKADIPSRGRFIHFRLKDPAKFHPALFSTMPIGSRGTLLRVGTLKSQIRKPAEFRAFLKRMGWDSARRRWRRTVADARRRDMIYQMRRAGIIDGARTQSVLVPRVRVERVVAKYTRRPQVRRAIGAAGNPTVKPRATARKNAILATLGINPPRSAKAKRPSRRNPRAQNSVIRIPFRKGQKVTPAAMERWLRSLPSGPIKTMLVKRYRQNIAQYRRFHKGSSPKHFVYQPVPMGANKGIVDVDFVTSEGKEWAAPYQVPKHSGKYAKEVDGRYIHAHGESGIDLTIKKPTKRKNLPERFHTADGKFVGVIPSKNVKIDTWYRG